MGLSELHRHLDGSLRPGTVRYLADVLSLDVPQKLAFSPGMGLDAALSRFGFTLSLLRSPAAVTRIADEMCEDAAVEGITTLEIRFAPQLHGDPLEAYIDAALEGIDGRAGLILCGLYGEDPAVLDRLVAAAIPREGVVGIDLAGGPTPLHRFGMEAYSSAFQRAAAYGIGRTVHAGEGRPAEEIAVAIRELKAQRIGHGTTLLDSGEVLDLVLGEEVTIEACPSSNWHTGVISRIEDHPLARWLRRGVRVCVNTDNTLLSGVTLPAELERVQRIEGIGAVQVEAFTAFGHEAAFVR